MPVVKRTVNVKGKEVTKYYSIQYDKKGNEKEVELTDTALRAYLETQETIDNLDLNEVEEIDDLVSEIDDEEKKSEKEEKEEKKPEEVKEEEEPKKEEEKKSEQKEEVKEEKKPENGKNILHENEEFNLENFNIDKLNDDNTSFNFEKEEGILLKENEEFNLENFFVDDIKDEGVYFVYENKVKEEPVIEKSESEKLLNSIFVYQKTAPDTLISSSMNLDKTKEYVTQKVSSSMFKDALDFIYTDGRIGHFRDDSFFGVGMTKVLGAAFNKLTSMITIEGDKDTNFHLDKENAKNKDKARELYRKKVVERSKTANIKQLEGEDFEEAKNRWIETEMNRYEKSKGNLEFNEIDFHEYLIEEKANYALKSKAPRETRDVKEDTMELKGIQYGIMAFLLGNGNPHAAFHQFLDKKALKDGDYVYDEKAITKFVKDTFYTEKELEDISANYSRTEDIVNDLENAKIYEKDENDKLSELYFKSNAERIAKERGIVIDSDDRVNNYKLALSDESHKRNRELFTLANTINTCQKIADRRSFWYKLRHPINTIKETIAINMAKRNLVDNLSALNGSKFKDSMIEYIKCKDEKKRDELKDIAAKNVSEPLDLNNLDAYENQRSELFQQLIDDSVIPEWGNLKEDFLDAELESTPLDVGIMNLDDAINNTATSKFTKLNTYKEMYAIHYNRNKPFLFGRSAYNEEGKKLSELAVKLEQLGIRREDIEAAKDFKPFDRKTVESHIKETAKEKNDALLTKLATLEEKMPEVKVEPTSKAGAYFLKQMAPAYKRLCESHEKTDPKTEFEKQYYKDEAAIIKKIGDSIKENIHFKDEKSFLDNVRIQGMKEEELDNSWPIEVDILEFESMDKDDVELQIEEQLKIEKEKEKNEIEL